MGCGIRAPTLPRPAGVAWRSHLSRREATARRGRRRCRFRRQRARPRTGVRASADARRTSWLGVVGRQVAVNRHAGVRESAGETWENSRRNSSQLQEDERQSCSKAHGSRQPRRGPIGGAVRRSVHGEWSDPGRGGSDPGVAPFPVWSPGSVPAGPLGRRRSWTSKQKQPREG